MLETPQRGGSNEYTQSMFWSKNRSPLYTPVLLYVVGYKVVHISRLCFPDVIPDDSDHSSSHVLITHSACQISIFDQRRSEIANSEAIANG